MLLSGLSGYGRSRYAMPGNSMYARKEDNVCTSLGIIGNNRNVLICSIALNVILYLLMLYAYLGPKIPPPVMTSTSTTDGVSVSSSPNIIRRGETLTWNGGHPNQERPGSCWCGGDMYCMCTPSLAIDLVIVSGGDHIWLVTRKDTSQLATMGGFVMVGETTEHAVRRELQEETGIVLDENEHEIVLVGVYDDPRRDNRRHTVSVVYAIHLDGTETPVASDDVKGMKRIPLTDIENHQYFADHMTILLDYRRILESRRGGGGGTTTRREDFVTSAHDFATDVARSVCVSST